MNSMDHSLEQTPVQPQSLEKTAIDWAVVIFFGIFLLRTGYMLWYALPFFHLQTNELVTTAAQQFAILAEGQMRINNGASGSELMTITSSGTDTSWQYTDRTGGAWDTMPPTNIHDAIDRLARAYLSQHGTIAM